MKLQEAVAEARRRLAGAGLPDSALEAHVLAMHVTGKSRAELYLSYPESLPASALAALNEVVQRRLDREPLAYITGHREFFGLDLVVDRRVLVPRQETETLVERAIEVVRTRFEGRCVIADVGTGSGAIALSLATALPEARVFATDASQDALDVAELNRHFLGLDDRVTLLRGDLLNPVPAAVDVVVANLPYVKEKEWMTLQPEIRLWEPPEALLSGKDGLAHARRLLRQIADMAGRPCWALFELGSDQTSIVKREALALFPDALCETFMDLAGLERGVVLGGLARSVQQAPTHAPLAGLRGLESHRIDGEPRAP